MRLPALRAARAPLVGWSLLWAVLAVLHVTQAIWLSGGREYPGSLGDGRFNQLVLEHGWKSLKGIYPWVSPGQFYPAENTLALSDTHAGTLPLYAAFRAAGISREEAWALWFVAVAALNTYAAFRLFRALNIAAWLRGPLVFASAGSAIAVWLAGTHMQMLPVFPALLAWERAVAWTERRGWWRLAAALGLFGWQFAVAPYTAFFAVVITGCVAALRLGFARGIAATPRPAPRLGVIASVAMFLFGLTAAALVARIYAQGIAAGHTRTFAELVQLCPTVTSWFTAPPTFLFYPANWPGHVENLVEQAWLPGFLLWVALVVTLLGARRPREQREAWLLALAGGTVATVLFFTNWTARGSGAWLRIADTIGPLRAFRSAGRVAGLLQFVWAGTAGLLLTRWQSSASSRAARIACVVAAVAIAAENLAHHQPATARAVAQQRMQATIDAWHRAGDRPILAFAPGYTNEDPALANLDAWSAALQLNRVTLNGYSGGVPGPAVNFCWNPTPAIARSLIASLGIDPPRVSIATGWTPGEERQLGIVRHDERPVVGLEGFALQPFRWTLFAWVESYVQDGKRMYQFTPPAEVMFHLPDSAPAIAYDVAMRHGSYDLGGHSDGVGITWLVQQAGNETPVEQWLLDPRDHPAQRDPQHRRFALPPGHGRVLILRVDAGPHGDTAWDWPLFTGLRAE